MPITSNKLSLAHSKRGNKAMWSTVNKLRGKIPPANANSNVDADTSNSCFASLTHPNILNPHISYKPHIIIILSHLSLYNTSLVKVNKQDLMVSQASFSNSSLLQSVSPCRPSTTTASSRHFFQLSGKVLLFTLLKNK